MRNFLLALLLFGAAFVLPAGRTRAQAAAPQLLFLGDKTCLDDAHSCVFPGVVASGRYLHVLVHDAPENSDWQVQAAPYCSGAMPTVGGGLPTDADGFREEVIDFAALEPSAEGSASCFVLRGRNHYDVTYYAAWIDNDPGPEAAALWPDYRTAGGRPDLPDIEVLYIHRDPSPAYDATPNRPVPGQQAVFRAHIANAGVRPALPFAYTWLVDGHTVATGTGPALSPGAETVLSFPWTWQDGPHSVSLVTQPAEPEISAGNDALSVRTDALLLGLWVEHSAREYFDSQQWLYCSALSCGNSDSFADWAQRQVARWNGLLAGAVFPGLAPTGIADRVALDEIVEVPDGSLPLAGGFAADNPDNRDRTVDLEWGIPATGVHKSFPDGWESAFDTDWEMLHELGHARSLSDLYRLDIAVGGKSVIDVQSADGTAVYNAADPLAVTNRLRAFYGPGSGQLLYQSPADDLMDCLCRHEYSAYDALVLNRIQGRRARCGNSNPPCNMGDWFLDLPPRNAIRLLAPGGRPLSDGTDVRLYFDTGTGYTDHAFAATDSQTITIRHGEIRLPADPFRAAGNPSRAGHNLLLLEIDPAHRDLFCFTDPTVFNLADWLGYRDAGRTAVYTLRLDNVSQNACNLSPPPALVNDPFATSPWRSTVTVRGKDIIVRLRDAERPAVAMRDRVVRILAHGRILDEGITGPDGAVHLHVLGPGPYTVIDATDNNLVIPAGR